MKNSVKNRIKREQTDRKNEKYQNVKVIENHLDRWREKDELYGVQHFFILHQRKYFRLP